MTLPEYVEQWNRQLTERYGRKRGWYRHHVCSVFLRLGGFRGLRTVDWSRAGRLVFVCKGNICRSPYAEARARQLGADAVSVGLEAGRDDPSDTVARAIATEFGLDLSCHRTRRIEDVVFGPRDLLLGMEPWHTQRLTGVSRHSGAQISLLGLWCQTPRPHIEDPYRRDPAYFRTCFGLLDSAVRTVIHRMALGDESTRQSR